MPLWGESAQRKWTKFEPYYEREGEFKIRIDVVDVEKWNHFLNLTPEFYDKYHRLFRNAVYEAHRYLIRVTPFDTGRLRAGWTSVLEKYRIDYAMAFIDTSLIETRSTVVDPAAIEEGKGLSTMVDQPFDVTVTNNVPYAQYVEYGTSKMQGRHFTQKAMYKAEYILAKAFDAWFKQMAEAGDITEPLTLEEVTA
ncbi:MAG: HK97 gp10 family phage protein [Gallionella sp.]|jgi:hypothetical protein